MNARLHEKFCDHYKQVRKYLYDLQDAEYLYKHAYHRGCPEEQREANRRFNQLLTELAVMQWAFFTNVYHEDVESRHRRKSFLTEGTTTETVVKHVYTPDCLQFGSKPYRMVMEKPTYKVKAQ